MKVVLFCGGFGLRMREHTSTPKPMAMLRNRPVLWHLMRYYAHFGHKDFILCLGYKAEAIKQYFLNYNECLSNDFVLSEGGSRIEPFARDIRDWRITFVDTGVDANIGERLRAVRPYISGEARFLANYADCLTDCPLPLLIDRHERTGAAATFIAVRPHYSFHMVRFGTSGAVAGIDDVRTTDLRINGGFFVLDAEIFDVLGEGEELVVEPFKRLLAAGRVSAYRYDGFWRGIDTFKDLHELEETLARGPGPWELWRNLAPPEGMAAE